MFLIQLKKTNRLREELSRLLSKGMSNIYLKVTIETFSELRFSGFKKFVTRSVLGAPTHPKNETESKSYTVLERRILCLSS